MCKELEDMRNETEERLKIDIALNMLCEGELSIEKIAQYTKLTLDKVKELAAPIKTI